MFRFKTVLMGCAAVILLAAQADAGTPISLYRSFAGDIDFVGTGGSLRTQPNTVNACSVTSSSSATLSGIPATATVTAAYLYWAGSYRTAAGFPPDYTITFESQSLTADRTFTETFTLDPDTFDYFSGFKDVTSIVAAKGNGTYTFSDLTVYTGDPHCTRQAVLSGWSMVVVYEDPGNTRLRVLNLYDGFQYFRGSEIVFTPGNFVIPTPPAPIDGRAGHITWEGDVENSAALNGYSENLLFNGNALTDGLDPLNNQFNSTINFLGNSSSYGVDFDIYDVTPYLNPGDTSATTTYRSGGDLVILSAEIVCVTNEAVTDLEIHKTHSAPFVAGQTGTFTIMVSNNGPNNNPGPITVTDVLPPGLSFVSIMGPGCSTGGWTVDTSAAPTLRFTHPGPLLNGQTLPPLTLNVAVDSAAIPSISNTAVVSSAIFDNISANNTSTDTATVPTLGVVKTSTADGLVDPGSVITYTTRITNWSSSVQTNVAVSDPLPDGTTYVTRSTRAVLSIPISGTFRDEFNTIAYTNNNGTVNWTTNWLEIGESDGANAGDIRVVADLSNNRLRVRNLNKGAQREANLSAYASATLSFDYRRTGLDNANDYVAVWVSANGGSSWTEVARFQGPTNDAAYVSAAYDITPYIASNTRIRFLASSSLGSNDIVYFDNVQIAASGTQMTQVKTNAAGDPTPLADGNPPNLVTAADGYTLQPGQSLIVTHNVTVDNPAAVTDVVNTASVTSVEQTTPIAASATDYVRHLDSWQSDYSTVKNLYYRDPDSTGHSTEPIYVGGSKFVPCKAYDVAYYDAAGNLVFTDTSASADADGLLKSTYSNSNNSAAYGMWTAVVMPDGTIPQATLAAQLARSTTLITDTFRVVSWSKTEFTDSSGNTAYGYDTSSGSAPAYLRVFDRDKNTNPSAIDTVTVTVTDPTTGDSETITLYETGPNTGEFANNASGARYTLPLSTTAGVNQNDGTLYISGGYNIQVSYTDSADSADQSIGLAYVPTLAVISSFSAFEDGGRTVVRWETAFEHQTVGFYIERLNEADGRFERVTENLLPGLLHVPQGGVYQYADETAPSGNTLTYRLIEAEFGGGYRVHGPFEATVQSGFGIFLSEPYSRMPHEISDAQKARLESMKAVREPAKAIRAVGSAVKAAVTAGGIYRVSASQIAEWIGESSETVIERIRNRTLSVTNRGRDVAYLPDEDGSGILFYGEPIDSIYTNQNIYRIAPGAGVQMVKVQSVKGNLNGDADTDMADVILCLQVLAGIGSEAVRPDYPVSGADVNGNQMIDLTECLYGLQRVAMLREDALPAAVSETQTFTDTVHIEKDNWPLPTLFHDPESDYWMWEYLYAASSASVSKTVVFQADSPSGAPDKGVLAIHLQGASNTTAYPDHHVRLYLNGTLLGEGFWDGTDACTLTLEFSQELLRSGDNTLEITGVADAGVPYSIVYLNSFDLTYKRHYRAARNQLLMTGDGNQIITVDGFSIPDIQVFDVSTPQKPKVLTTLRIENSSSGYRVSFHPADPKTRYIAMAKDARITPAALDADIPSTLKQRENRAACVVIAPSVLSETAQTLANYRKSQGLESIVVRLEDIYDEFSNGIVYPEAVRDFLSYAYRNWEQTPRYAVLIGAGTYDYKNRQSYGDNLMPPLMVGTSEGLFPSDNRFADVDGDGIPEMAVGRLPVLSTDELSKLIEKIKTYESGLSDSSAWRKRVMMLADRPGPGGNFSADSNEVAALLPSGYTADKIHLADYSLADARQKVFDGINAGCSLVNFIGHGAVDRLTQDGLLVNNDMASLTNTGKFPIVSALTCVVGQFAIPGYSALGETLLVSPDRGAAGVWSPSGLSLNPLAKTLDAEFFKAVFVNGEPTIGDAVLSAFRSYRTLKGETYMPGIYILLGDPALRLKATEQNPVVF